MDTLNIIDEIRAISDKRIADRLQKQKRGEYYNIFNDLHMMSDEVHLHSSFLATLLDPKGSHGQGNLFLKAFLDMLSAVERKSQASLDFDITSVEVEKSIGTLDEETGGRIDLYITDGKYQIIIENKIYAGDQINQMKRYWNYGMSNISGAPFKLIYLTLDGHQPSKSSRGSLSEQDYICLSYESNILSWLEKCIEIVSDVPPVRETIMQYIRTIKILTNNDMEQELIMEREMLEILGRKENIDAVFDIFESRDSLINYIINEVFLPDLKKLVEGKGFKMQEVQKNWMYEDWAGVSFINERWKNFKLSFEFESRPIGNLIFGFQTHINEEEIKSWQELVNRYKPYAVGNGWIYKGFEGHRYWNNREAIKDLLNGRTLRVFDKMFDDAIICARGLDM